MKNRPDFYISDFNYPLPQERIAAYPLQDRDGSKLLLFRDGDISHTNFFNLSNNIPENSMIVFNDTRVVNARLLFEKETGAAIEIFCLEPVSPSDYALVFQSVHSCEWNCLVGNLKKWKSGSLKKIISHNNREVTISADITKRGGDSHNIQFSWNDKSLSFAQILETAGNIPIPPYLNRKSEDIDQTRYQTIYGVKNGSVAAPTAGLHFTDSVNEKLEKKGIFRDKVTLHVGAGTFKPVQSEKISGHEMHHETVYITRENVANLMRYAGNITATGTTTVRTIESLYWLGVKMNEDRVLTPEYFSVSQWEPYDLRQNVPVCTALENILNYMDKKNLKHISGSTQIMIAPGYSFRLTDRIITNFHQPGSTLLLLIAAFAGPGWKKIYEYALNNGFRFLSYGDSSLLYKSKA